jgi:signal transduction histidine kinase/CheY-like chemotaxis protein
VQLNTTKRKSVDRVLVQALVLVCVACVIMVGNRWFVARQQADLIRGLLLANARGIVDHTLTTVADASLGPSLQGALVAEVVALSEHHAAALLTVDGRLVAGQARLSDAGFDQERLARSDVRDGSYLDAAGGIVPVPGFFDLMPPFIVADIAGPPGPSAQKIRLLVSLATARREQLYLFDQAVLSATLLVAVAVAFLWWVLRTPRRSLDAASRYAALLPQGTHERLPRIDSHIVAIDALRHSLNEVADVLEQQRVRQRHDETALKRALREAESATEAKSAFVANISHEIRTPLNGMVGLTELLLADALTPQQRHYLQLSRQSSQQLLAIVNDVLDLSKVEARRMTLEAIPFPLYELLDEMLPLFAVRAAEKGLELLNQICPNLPLVVVGDPHRLRQVIDNLIGNALKFTPSGHVRLHVSSAPSTGVRGSVALRFEVSDTGPGIAPERHAAVLQAFGQADASTAREHGGTGLGLTISAALLQMMGSQLQIESEPERGCRFHFEVAFPLPVAADASAPTHFRHWPDRRALWVDPHPCSRAWFRQALALWSLQVDAVDTLDAACETLAAADPTVGIVFVCGSLLNDASPEAIAALLRWRGDARVVSMLDPRDRLPAALQASNEGMATLMKPVSPRHLNQALSTTRPPVHGGQPPAVVPVLAGLRVLLAEDNDVNVIVATALLAQLGAQVVHAPGGEQALQRALAEPFDLVLMDLQMPGMNGHAACTALRAAERVQQRTRVPVIAMTAHLLEHERERMAASEMDGYIGKPFLTTDLVREITRVLERQPA